MLSNVMYEYQETLKRADYFFNVAREMMFRSRDMGLFPSDVFPVWVYFATGRTSLLECEREIFLDQE